MQLAMIPDYNRLSLFFLPLQKLGPVRNLTVQETECSFSQDYVKTEYLYFLAELLFSCCLILNREAVKTSKQIRKTIGGASFA